MQVAEAATLWFDDDVSWESRHRIIGAIADMNPPRTELVEVRAPGHKPFIVIAHEDFCTTLKEQVKTGVEQWIKRITNA
jgi:hypothetical protein